jgi:hypothetical protein
MHAIYSLGRYTYSLIALHPKKTEHDHIINNTLSKKFTFFIN